MAEPNQRRGKTQLTLWGFAQVKQPLYISRMRILILQAHPRPSSSIVQHALLNSAKSIPGVTVHDLYAAYPDFGIDVAHEQALLLEHDLVVLQHPFYWYSSPAILKEWQDIVLDFGWAYGPEGDRLHGKYMMQVISTGGAEGFYHAKGRNRFSIDELLSPFNQTAHLCGMAYLKPFIIYEGRRMSDDVLEGHVTRYRDLLTSLAQDQLNPLKHLAENYSLPTNFKAKAKA
jgi:glutathione-regulated potassium-efflux system ancillary protein KefG